MTIAYQSGDFTTATAVNAPSFSAPFDGVNVDYVLTQDFMQNAADFVPLPLNTPHPDFPDFLLVQEPSKPDQGGLIFRWTRTYAKVPDSYTEPGGTYGYTFIGFTGANQTAGLVVVYSFTGRERFTLPVQLQTTRDFFLVDAGGPYTTWESIPSISAQRYFISAPVELDIDYINAAAASVNVTTPSREDYEAMMAADAADQTSFSIVAETSVLTRWLGNIFLRETKRIKAI